MAWGQDKAGSDAMSTALQRLEEATKQGSQADVAEALCDVASIDYSASLDAEAENYATQAENLSRKEHLPVTLARALIIKANVCLFAETDSLFNRNDEGLEYALEAVSALETAQNDSLLMEAYCSASQLYVNKNRWNKTLDKEWYKLAGQYLDKAESIGSTIGSDKATRFLAYRMRYYRQANELDKAISYCENALAQVAEDDNLLKAQIYDHLTPLYAAAGLVDASVESHSAYVRYFTLYSRQTEADKLQELQGRYELDLKQTQIERKTYQFLFLLAIALLLLVLAVVLVHRNRRERRLREQAERDNIAKQELIEFMSSDLKNPLNSGINRIEEFVSKAGKMTEEQIADESHKLIEGEQKLSHDVAEYVSELVISRQKTAAGLGLSSRELEIIHLSLEGLSTQKIAEALNISVRTVSNHKSNIYDKMGVRTNAEMCKIARENGLN